MLKDKMLWMKDSGNIRDEIRQCREEGRMISGLLPRAEEILSMEEGPEKESCARQLLLELENCPVDEAFPFEEPVEWEKLAAACEGNGIHLQIPEEELQDRIRGAWTGRASGCLLGVPVEGWSREKIRGYLEESGQYPLEGYIRSDTEREVREKYGVKDVDEGTAYDRQNICWINNMDTYPVDDDMNYTVLSLRVLERSGSNFTSEDVAQSWLFGLPAFHTCTAERVAYRNLMHGILPPESGILANPFREWIGAQIRVDFYGYIAAGNPALAMKQIPRNCRLYAALKELLDSWKKGASWEELLEAIHGKYEESNSFDWCLAIPNALIVTACVLCFGTDYSQAVIHAVLAGFDTDCNGATVGSVVGIALGCGGIDSRWTEPVKQIICSSVNSYTRLSVEEVTERTIAVMKKL